MVVIVFIFLICFVTHLDRLLVLDAPLLNLQFSSGVEDLAWNSDGSILALSAESAISFLYMDSQEIEYRLEQDIFAVQELTWIPQTSKILIVQNTTDSWDFETKRWLPEQRFLPSALLDEYYLPNDIEWNPAANEVAIVFHGCLLSDGTFNHAESGAPGARVEIWNIDNGKRTTLIPCIRNSTARVEWNPDGSRLAIYSLCQLSVWEMETLIWTRDDKGVSCNQSKLSMTWSYDGQQIAIDNKAVVPAISDPRQAVQIIDANSGEDLQSFYPVNKQFGSINTLDWHPTEDIMIVGDASGWLSLWDPRRGMMIQDLLVADGAIFEATWSPKGCFVAASSLDGSLYLWKTESHTECEPASEENGNGEH